MPASDALSISVEVDYLVIILEYIRKIKYSYIWIDRHVIVVEKRMNSVVKQQTILNGIDKYSGFRLNRDPVTVVVGDLVIFMC
jgi:hypothetical protein